MIFNLNKIINNVVVYHKDIEMSIDTSNAADGGVLALAAALGNTSLNEAGTPAPASLNSIVDDINHNLRPSLDSLMLLVVISRAELLDGSLRKQVQDVQAKNAELGKYNEILAVARSNKMGATDKEKRPVSATVANFMAAKGIPFNNESSAANPTTLTGKELNSAEWDLLVENIRGYSESLTSTSQLDMTKLQSISGKYNQTFEMGSQFISKYFRNTDTLIKNI